MCIFELSIRKDFVERIMRVSYTGSIPHKAGEKHSWFIKEDEQEELKNNYKMGLTKHL